MHSPFQRPYLTFNRRASIDRQDLESLHIFRIVIQVPCNLQAKFPRRTQDKRLRYNILNVNFLYQRQSEGSGLSGSRLRKCHNVIVFAQKVRNHFLLYGHRVRIAHLFNGATDLRCDAKLFKCLHQITVIYSGHKGNLFIDNAIAPGLILCPKHGIFRRLIFSR